MLLFGADLVLRTAAIQQARHFRSKWRTVFLVGYESVPTRVPGGCSPDDSPRLMCP